MNTDLKTLVKTIRHDWIHNYKMFEPLNDETSRLIYSYLQMKYDETKLDEYKKVIENTVYFSSGGWSIEAYRYKTKSYLCGLIKIKTNKLEFFWSFYPRDDQE